MRIRKVLPVLFFILVGFFLQSCQLLTSSAPAPIQITYNSLGGPEVETVTILPGETIVAPSIEREGYAFGGWYTSSNQGTLLENRWDFTKPVMSAVTLYAKWTINSYSISFVTNGGSTVPTLTYNYHATVQLPFISTKEGFTFNGWFLNEGLTEPFDVTVMPAQGLTLYAKWIANQYTLSFNADFGSEVTSITADYGTPLQSPATPTRAGYTFDGWYSDANLTQPYSFTTMPSQNLLLYAKWIETLYDVTFNANGGTSIASQSVKENDLVEEPIESERMGYTFSGWYDSATFNTLWDFSQRTVTQHQTLYAKWTANQYTLSFNANLGSEVTAITADYGTSLQSPAAPTRAGYTFDRWYSDVNLTQPFTFTTMPAQNLLLYAKWNLVPYLYEFDTAGSYSSGIADGVIPSDRIVVKNSGAASIVASFQKNASTTFSIFNNSGGEIRLYQGSGNGGQLTFTLANGYVFTALTINVGTENSGLKINDGSTNSTKAGPINLTFSSAQQSIIIKNVGTTRADIVDIKLTYTLNPSTDDVIGPVVTLSNQAMYLYAVGETWNHATALSWCTATDAIDGVVACELSDSTVNTAVAGTYTITYSAQDAKGNITTVERTITVVDQSAGGTLQSLDYSGYSNYYTSIDNSTNVVVDMAKLLRNTVSYVSYGDARYVYSVYDNGSQVILYDVPTSASYRKVTAVGTEGWGSGGVITTSTFSITINREHVWACSDMRIMPTDSDRTLDKYVGYKINNTTWNYRPENTDRGHYSDLHNLWNALAGPNNTHNDHFYGQENGLSVGPYLANDIFYPGDEYRGDIARMLFYMTLMYPHLTLVNKGSPNAVEGTIYYGYLNVLLQWNEDDPVSDYERTRNDLNFAQQGNRNPFIDFYSQNFASLLFALGDPNVLDA